MEPCRCQRERQEAPIPRTPRERWLDRITFTNFRIRHFYHRQTEGWREHATALEGERPRLYVQAALHVALARLRCYHTRWQLATKHDLTDAADSALVCSLLGVTETDRSLAWRVRDAALWLRWVELAGTRDCPCSTWGD